MENYYHGKEICIVGGTGSLAKALLKELFKRAQNGVIPKGVRLLSRGEFAQWQMMAEFIKNRPPFPVQFMIGDIRDYDRMRRALTRVDIVFHTAAQKQVPSCESHPAEAIETNIRGSENVMNAAIDCGVSHVMYTNSDKAVKPVNLYGATKMAAERLFINGNVYGGGRTKFSACRYGNVVGSRGSVFSVFNEQAEAGQKLTITSMDMTRFWISLPTIAKFILDRTSEMEGGEIFVPRMKSLSVYEMACYMANLNYKDIKTRDRFTETGIRQGEKLHEILFAQEEYVRERCTYYGDSTAVKDRFYEVYYTDNGRVYTGKELSSLDNENGGLTADELTGMLKEAGI